MLYFTVPITIQLLITSSLSMIDSIMVGRLGVESIAAVGVSNKISQILIIMLQGFASGTTIFCAQYWGMGNKRGISRSVLYVSALASVFAILFTTIAWIFPSQLIGIFSDDTAVIEIGVDFLKITGVTYIFTALTMIFAVALKTTGEVRLPTLYSVLALFVNTSLNYVLIYGHFGAPEMGVKGAAIATLIARIIQTGLLFMLLVRKEFISWKIIKENLDVFRSDLSRRYFKVTFPSIINHATWGIGDTLFFWLYASLGTNETAAISLIDPIIFIFTCVFSGISDASSVMVGNEIGANRKNTAFQYAKEFLKITTVLSIIAGTFIYIFMPYVLSMYEITSVVEDLVYQLIYVYLAISVAKNVNYINNVGILRTGGDTKYVMWLDTIGVWCVGLPLAALGVYFQVPLFIIYFGANCHEIIRAIIGVRRTLTKKWIQNIIEDY